VIGGAQKRNGKYTKNTEFKRLSEENGGPHFLRRTKVLKNFEITY